MREQSREDRLPRLMAGIEEELWGEELATRFVASGDSGQAVETGAAFMGWGNDVQSRLRKLGAVYHGFRKTWDDSVAPEPLGKSWTYYDAAPTATPFEGGLTLATALGCFRSFQPATRCDWLPELLRECLFYTGDTWSCCGDAQSPFRWDTVEVDGIGFDRLNRLTAPLPQTAPPGQSPPKRLLELRAPTDTSVELGLYEPQKSSDTRGMHRSLPITVITTPRLTVTTTIAATTTVNGLVVPVKVFALREKPATVTGGHWDEMVGYTAIFDNPDRQSGKNTYDGRIWFRRSYQLTDLARWQGFMMFHTRSNGAQDKWQLFPPSDLCTEPSAVSREVDWHPTERNGYLSDSSGRAERRRCSQTAPDELEDLTERLRTASPSHFARKLSYDLLTNPPTELVDLLLKP